MSVTLLPSEILAIIASIVYEDGSQLVRSISPFSLVSKSLRSVSLAHLFSTKTITRSTPQELYPCSKAFLEHLTSSECTFAQSVKIVKLKSWHRRCWLHREHYDIVSDANERCDRVVDSAFKEMTGLQTIYLETLDDFVADVLSSLCHRPLHIVLDTRLSLTPNKDTLCESWDSLLRNPSWTWSFGLYNYDPYNRLASSVLRPCALEWYWGGLNHVYDSNCLATTCDRELVEEVHFSEIMQDLLRNTLPNIKSGNLELHTFISGIPRLKRLSLVGHELSTKLLQHITEFQELEQLRIYSPYRKSFHFGCSEDGEIEPTAAVAQMPWFRLPKLTSLDIRFICTHIPIAHLVPPNLKHLAVEYYDRNARFSPSDLGYIASTSPGLEILEMDSIDLRDYEGWTADSLSLPDEHHLLKPLGLFKNLKTLKLIPSYWYDNHLIPRPVLSIDWTVLFFRRVRSLCLSLRTLVICISFGECPHGSIYNMSTRLRPVKFILKDQFDDRVLLRYGISGTKKLHERLYWADHRVEKLGTVLEHRRAYFDDLSEGWILPHMQVPDWGESNDVSDED